MGDTCMFAWHEKSACANAAVLYKTTQGPFLCVYTSHRIAFHVVFFQLNMWQGLLYMNVTGPGELWRVDVVS